MTKSPRASAFLAHVACPVCGMPFWDQSSTEQEDHLKSHMNEEERQASLSSSSSSQPQQLKALIRKPRRRKPQLLATGFFNQCQSCGKLIAKKSWRAHQLGHTNNNMKDEGGQAALPPAGLPPPSFVCHICGVGYASKESLKRHTAAVHPDGTWDGPWKCLFPDCSSVSHSFDSELGRQSHVAGAHGSTEQAVSRILCLLCGKVCASSWAVKLHTLTHSKERKFKCELCSKSYPLKATLNQHLAAVHGQGQHSGEFRCGEVGCGQLFPCNTYLKSHMRRVHGMYMRGKRKAEDS